MTKHNVAEYVYNKMPERNVLPRDHTSWRKRMNTLANSFHDNLLLPNYMHLVMELYGIVNKYCFCIL